jgi:glutaredoxin
MAKNNENNKMVEKNFARRTIPKIIININQVSLAIKG